MLRCSVSGAHGTDGCYWLISGLLLPLCAQQYDSRQEKLDVWKWIQKVLMAGTASDEEGFCFGIFQETGIKG